MNSEVIMRGTSSRNIWAYGPHLSGWTLQSFWRAYRDGGDDAYSQARFENLVRTGNIICFAIAGGGVVKAQFGLQLMRDRHGPYVQFIFFASDFARLELARELPAVVDTCLRTARLYKQAEKYKGDMRLLLVGRKGWRRVARRLGLVMDDRGWITENQKAFKNGYVGIKRLKQ